MRIVNVTPGGLISFTTVSNKLYRLEYRNDLTTGSWLPLTNNAAMLLPSTTTRT